MIATPIFINTFVVFVRLYWFERRFQHVAQEARAFRRTRSRSRTKTEVADEPDIGKEERGVRGRSITVLHNKEAEISKGSGQATLDATKQSETESSSASSSSQGEKPTANHLPIETPLPQSPSIHREVTFADEVDEVGELRSSGQVFPRKLSAEEQIAFLENQRNPKDKGTLRIPGPREFDRGDLPETLIEEEDGGGLSHKITSPLDDRESALSGGPVKRNITIDEPSHPRQRTGTGLSRLSVPSYRGTLSHQNKAPSAEEGEEEKVPQSARIRTRTGTFSSLRNWGSKEPEPPTPYLSWQPTIGRNSAFVDLTEEQREELGGIEYRSLKTLAVVLVCKR